MLLPQSFTKSGTAASCTVCVLGKEGIKYFSAISTETANKTALRLNGYRADEWEKAKPLKEVLLTLNKLAPGGLIAGFNVTFDWMFLEIAYRRLGIEPNFDYHKLDVLAIAWAQVLPDTTIKEVNSWLLVQLVQQLCQIHLILTA